MARRTSRITDAPRSTAVGVMISAATLLALVGAGSASAEGHPLYGFANRVAAQAGASSAAHASGRVSPDDGDGGGDGEEDPLEVADQAASYAFARSAPALSVSAQALLAARAAAATLPTVRATTTEITGEAYNAEPAGYSDPYWSNAGAGFGIVSGRTTALATDGSTYYAGTADGGVWKSADRGQHWTSIWDSEPTLSIGSLLVTRDHALWVGTGESNTSSDSYAGTGTYRSTNGGRTFTRVGGNELVSTLSARLVDDGVGHVYEATSHGLWRHADSTTSGAWTNVLKPDPNPSNSPYDTSIMTDVVVRPGTYGKVVLAALGWRNGTSYNGFYESTTGGGAGSFRKLAPTGAIDATDIGRTTFAYAADGTRLYAIVESPKELLGGDATNLQGVYKSASGDPAGPWTRIAGSAKLDSSGSALEGMDGYHVGIQSWYNQALAVDPTDANHVYVSLEEVFQTTDGGKTFTTASPYWNYGLACGDSCPKTTHPDQHALALSASGDVLIANDGGVYSRPESIVGYGHWNDLNLTLRTLQYYDAAAGTGAKGETYWGGLQDNGTSVLDPGATTNLEPAGGDGGTVLVNPTNGKQAVGEYTDLAMYRTSDGGHTFTTISPECGYYTGADCDPSARFIAPFRMDVHDPNHWVAGGNEIWDTAAGWSTTCAGTSCDWKPVHNLGTDAAGGYNVATAIAVSGRTTYAGWVDSSGNPSPNFQSGIDTNYGGDWHRISSPVLPNRFIAGITVDPANPAHVYAVYNGYSRRWIPGGGLGTVLESKDGGATWRNISGNLPDAPGDGLATVHGHLVLATDVGVFTATAADPTAWARIGSLPNAVANDVRPIPGANAVVVATHGRGMWRIDLT